MFRISIQVLIVMILAGVFALIVSIAYAPTQKLSIVGFVNTNKEDINAWSTIVIAVFTVILSVCTVWLAVSTQGMLGETKKSIDLTRLEFLSTHRPKIRVKHLWLKEELSDTEPIKINLTIVNTGTVNARLAQVGLRYHIEKNGRDLPIDPNIRALRGFGGFELASGLNYTIEDISDGTFLDKHQMLAIEQERAKLYCVGYISYLDETNRTRITGFCRILIFPRSLVPLPGTMRFIKFDDVDYEYED